MNLIVKLQTSDEHGCKDCLKTVAEFIVEENTFVEFKERKAFVLTKDPFSNYWHIETLDGGVQMLELLNTMKLLLINKPTIKLSNIIKEVSDEIMNNKNKSSEN